MRTCAVIPAAGQGSRLGLPVPKLLAPVRGSDTVWTLLSSRLHGVVHHIHVVASPEGQEAIERAVRRGAPRKEIGESTGVPATSVGVQLRPTGMGDAVFCSEPAWQHAKTLLIVWGDQVHVSAETLRSAVSLHEGAPRRIVLPLVEVDAPYVAYRFDRSGRLDCVLQRREGDACPVRGLSDVGTFALSTRGLAKAWAEYCRGQPRGALTGEVNFLPFLVYLSGRGWEVLTCTVRDPLESRGINTPDDLEWVRTLYQHSKDEESAHFDESQRHEMERPREREKPGAAKPTPSKRQVDGTDVTVRRGKPELLGAAREGPATRGRARRSSEKAQRLLETQVKNLRRQPKP